MRFGSYQEALLANLSAGLSLGFVASVLAGTGSSWIGRICLLVSGILCVWSGLFLGVTRGFDTWQSMPDPPDEAFADGAKLMGALIAGWIPATLVVATVFGASWFMARAYKRRMR